MKIMRVKDVLFDEMMGSVVLLIDPKETTILPIWIGIFESQAIAIGLHGVDTPRPMTHDLMNNLCQTLGARVKKIVVNDIRDGTFYAEIYLDYQEKEIVIDSRPSDAIALALKAGVDLFVADKVFTHAVDIKTLDPEKQKELKELLDASRPATDKKMYH